MRALPPSFQDVFHNRGAGDSLPTATGVGPEPEADRLPADAEESEALEVGAVLLDVAAEPPPGVAALYVGDDGGDRFVIEGFGPHARLHNLAEEDRLRPEISLADSAHEHGQGAIDIIGMLYTWSNEKKPIAGWFGALVRDGTATVLKIEDTSGQEIPWEMVSLVVDDEITDDYLGAEIAVTRVACAAAPARAVSAAARTRPAPVLAYLSDDLDEKGTEIQSLPEIRVDERSSLAEFIRRLKQAPGEYALVYLACHGTYSDAMNEVRLASRPDGGEQISLGALTHKLRHLQLPRPVFINACHSGRLFKDRRLQTRPLHGFADLFLTRGAPAVVGTVGEVDGEFAAAFARDLLKDAVDNRDIPFAELVRRRRAAIAARYRDDEATDYDFVRAFMYVYYGDPDWRLQIETETAP
jgi:hypothetical protein